MLWILNIKCFYSRLSTLYSFYHNCVANSFRENVCKASFTWISRFKVAVINADLRYNINNVSQQTHWYTPHRYKLKLHPYRNSTVPLSRLYSTLTTTLTDSTRSYHISSSITLRSLRQAIPNHAPDSAHCDLTTTAP